MKTEQKTENQNTTETEIGQRTAEIIRQFFEEHPKAKPDDSRLHFAITGLFPYTAPSIGEVPSLEHWIAP